ncbi:MAG: 23S rRNA (pseudouridine(1915)-N(3))-methyltransferase RlmH [Zoogloeaceae bacterium]|jgi:23S rRNA (pseudouridine1915-N3)-methyltransferase|nr:23S rRNA (pseudouridine(1915)-N(3))-methyltransferase RlmH [Zoogloeaceae bacterium]
MKLTLLAVGHRQPDWVREGCGEYLKRLPREIAARILEIKPEPRTGKTRAQLLAAEGERIRDVCKTLGAARLVVLDEKGKDLTTRGFADLLARWMQEGDIVFLIGGADGLEDALKAEAGRLLRLSSLTLPHGMARLLLCEQLYRAVSLLKNHPYHRE